MVNRFISFQSSFERQLDIIFSLNYHYNGKTKKTTPEEIKKLVSLTTKYTNNIDWAKRFAKLFASLPDNRSFEERLSSIRYNADFFINTDINKLINKEKYFQSISLGDINDCHPESAFEYKIWKDKDISVATFNFYFDVDKEKNVFLRINNIQGYRGSWEVLSTINWRLLIVNKLHEYSKINHINLIGELPVYYGGKEPNLRKEYHERYIRQVKYYIITYLKAGVPIENINLNSIRDKGYIKRLKSILNKIDQVYKRSNGLERKNIIRAIEKTLYYDKEVDFPDIFKKYENKVSKKENLKPVIKKKNIRRIIK